MQISTNWSVSHLRHWRPPVASSGYYLYRYTGRSWFKSKQSALRSILPNANIHHNEKGPRDRTMTDSWCPYWCLLLTPKEEDKSNPVSPVGLYEAAHTKQDWEDVIHGSTTWECGWWLSVSLRNEKTGSQTKGQGKPKALRDDRKSWWYIRRWWTAKVGVPFKCRELGSFWWVGKEMGVWGIRGVGVGFGSPWAKPQLRDSINSKSAAKQHDLCSLRKYHSTLFTKNREGE